MRYISLFSGIEAASVAWGPLGWEPAAFAEIDKFPSAVLAERFPQVPNLGDVEKVDWSPYAESVDLVVGGSPCQAFSVAGNRRGLMDARGRLMLEYCRAVREIRPRWLLWENVPGVLSQDRGRAFGTLLGELEEFGYSLAWRVLDAQFFGVAQRRRRVFLVGHLGTRAGAPAAVLFEPDCLRRDTPSGRKKREELAAAAQAGAGGSYTMLVRCGCDGGGKGALVQEDVSATLSTSNIQTLFQPCDRAECYPINEMVATRHKAMGERTAFGVGSDGDPAYTITTAHPHAVCFQQNQRDEVRLVGGDGDTAGAIAAQSGMKNTSYIMERRCALTQYGEEVAGTLTARADSSPCADRGANVVCVSDDTSRASVDEDLCGTLKVGGMPPSVARGYVVRRLTPTECERLQGFPDGWTQVPWRGKPADECPDTPRYKALGNSMAVPCMRWIGERIQMVDEILEGR